METKSGKQGKKQILLRLNKDIWDELARMADDEFRSINGQIEYIIHEAFKKQRKIK